MSRLHRKERHRKHVFQSLPPPLHESRTLFFFFLIFIYLAVPDLSCELLVAAYGI